MTTHATLAGGLALAFLFLATPLAATAQDACPNPVTQVGLFLGDIDETLTSFQQAGGRDCPNFCRQLGRICQGIAKAHERCAQGEIKGAAAIGKLQCKADPDPRSCGSEVRDLGNVLRDASRGERDMALAICSAAAVQCAEGCR